MKSKEIIKILQELDPSGEIDVCVGNADILDISKLPAYYDGHLRVLKRTFNLISGIEYKTKGVKICIQPYDVRDYIMDNYENLDLVEITFDYDPPNWQLELIEKYKKEAMVIQERLKNFKHTVEKLDG